MFESNEKIPPVIGGILVYLSMPSNGSLLKL